MERPKLPDSLPTPDWCNEEFGIALYNRDCLELLPQIPDGCIDAVVTDPPYSSGGQFRGDRSGSTASKYLGSYNSTTAGKLPEVVGDNRDSRSWGFWATMWMSRLLNASSDGALMMCFTDWRQLPTCTDAIQASGWVWRGVAVWDKKQGRPMSGRFSHRAEFVVWGSRGAMGWDFDLPCGDGVMQYKCPPSANRAHQTEKPIELIDDMTRIVRPSAVVFDGFVGSGTTAMSCINTNRAFIGCEISADYFQIAIKRIEDAIEKAKGGALFTESNK